MAIEAAGVEAFSTWARIHFEAKGFEEIVK